MITAFSHFLRVQSQWHTPTSRYCRILLKGVPRQKADSMREWIGQQAKWPESKRNNYLEYLDAVVDAFEHPASTVIRTDSRDWIEIGNGCHQRLKLIEKDKEDSK